MYCYGFFGDKQPSEMTIITEVEPGWLLCHPAGWSQGDYCIVKKFGGKKVCGKFLLKVWQKKLGDCNNNCQSFYSSNKVLGKAFFNSLSPVEWHTFQCSKLISLHSSSSEWCDW